MLNRKLTLTKPEGEGAEPQKCPEVLFRKWSAMKLIAMFGDVEEIGSALGDDFALDKDMTAPQIAKIIAKVGEKTVRKVATLIASSVQSPKDVTADDVLDWDIEDFVQAIVMVLEMNFTDGLRKNFGRLRGVLSSGVEAVAPAEAARNGGPQEARPARARATASG